MKAKQIQEINDYIRKAEYQTTRISNVPKSYSNFINILKKEDFPSGGYSPKFPREVIFTPDNNYAVVSDYYEDVNFTSINIYVKNKFDNTWNLLSSIEEEFDFGRDVQISDNGEYLITKEVLAGTFNVISVHLYKRNNRNNSYNLVNKFLPYTSPSGEPDNFAVKTPNNALTKDALNSYTLSRDGKHIIFLDRIKKRFYFYNIIDNNNRIITELLDDTYIGFEEADRNISISKIKYFKNGRGLMFKYIKKSGSSTENFYKLCIKDEVTNKVNFRDMYNVTTDDLFLDNSVDLIDFDVNYDGTIINYFTRDGKFYTAKKDFINVSNDREYFKLKIFSDTVQGVFSSTTSFIKTNDIKNGKNFYVFTYDGNTFYNFELGLEFSIYNANIPDPNGSIPEYQPIVETDSLGNNIENPIVNGVSTFFESKSFDKFTPSQFLQFSGNQFSTSIFIQNGPFVFHYSLDNNHILLFNNADSDYPIYDDQEDSNRYSNKSFLLGFDTYKMDTFDRNKDGIASYISSKYFAFGKNITDEDLLFNDFSVKDLGYFETNTIKFNIPPLRVSLENAEIILWDEDSRELSKTSIKNILDARADVNTNDKYIISTLVRQDKTVNINGVGTAGQVSNSLQNQNIISNINFIEEIDEAVDDLENYNILGIDDLLRLSNNSILSFVNSIDYDDSSLVLNKSKNELIENIRFIVKKWDGIPSKLPYKNLLNGGYENNSFFKSTEISGGIGWLSFKEQSSTLLDFINYNAVYAENNSGQQYNNLVFDSRNYYSNNYALNLKEESTFIISNNSIKLLRIEDNATYINSKILDIGQNTSIINDKLFALNYNILEENNEYNAPDNTAFRFFDSTTSESLNNPLKALAFYTLSKKQDNNFNSNGLLKLQKEINLDYDNNNRLIKSYSFNHFLGGYSFKNFNKESSNKLYNISSRIRNKKRGDNTIQNIFNMSILTNGDTSSSFNFDTNIIGFNKAVSVYENEFKSENYIIRGLGQNQDMPTAKIQFTSSKYEISESDENRKGLIYLEVEYEGIYYEEVNFKVIYDGPLSDFYHDNEVVYTLDYDWDGKKSIKIPISINDDKVLENDEEFVFSLLPVNTGINDDHLGTNIITELVLKDNEELVTIGFVDNGVKEVKESDGVIFLPVAVNNISSVGDISFNINTINIENINASNEDTTYFVDKDEIYTIGESNDNEIVNIPVKIFNNGEFNPDKVKRFRVVINSNSPSRVTNSFVDITIIDDDFRMQFTETNVFVNVDNNLVNLIVQPINATEGFTEFSIVNLEPFTNEISPGEDIAVRGRDFEFQDTENGRLKVYRMNFDETVTIPVFILNNEELEEYNISTKFIIRPQPGFHISNADNSSLILNIKKSR